MVIEATVDAYMTTSVVSISATATLDHARELIERMRISALPVLDDRERPIGVISRSDLLHAGKLEPMGARGRAALRLPDAQVDSAMSRGIVTISPSTSVMETARILVDQQIHRVYVENDYRLTGVFSTRDVMKALVDARVPIPLSTIMTTPVITVEAAEPVRVAIERLEQSALTGLAVLEAGEPVGTFTQEDALASRMHPPDMPVSNAMGFFFLVLAASTPVHMAAARASALRVRHILVEDDGSLGPTIRPPGIDQPSSSPGALAGVVTGIDLAGAALLSG